MAQQTAMQEAIEYLKLFNLEASAIILEDRFLEKEKQQIMKAVYDGMGANFDPNMGRAEEYFKQTYNK